MLKALLDKFRPEYETYEFIRVKPTDLRGIVMLAVDELKKPTILVEGKPVRDYSPKGPLQSENIGNCSDFEIRDGRNPVMGFHEGPRNMWISKRIRFNILQ